jgi:tetratricopeptide (TPR) repeat protein
MAMVVCGLTSAAPKKSELEKQGLEALAAYLPDVAAARFSAQLAVSKDDAEEELRLRLLLAESWVRADQAEQALAVLEHPTLAESATALFWKAQALGSQGDLQAAIVLLDQVIETQDFPLFGEAVLTRSRFLSAQGNHRAAIAGLNLLTTTKSPLATRAKIDQARLLLHTAKNEDARKALPSQKLLKGSELLEVQLIDAALLQQENEFTKAAAAYTAILARFTKEGEELPAIIHPAAVGYARALASLKQRSEATDALLAFIQNQPNSPSLEDAFALLRSLLLESTTPDDPVLTLINARLLQWSASPPIVSPAIFPNDTFGVADQMPIIDVFDHPELHVQALYLRIIALADAKEMEQQELQRRMVTQLRMEHPTHPLAQAAMIDLARTYFRNNQFEKARYLLENLIESEVMGSSEISAYLLLAAELHRKQEFAQSAQTFEKAASLLTSTARSNAMFNAGISWLLAGDQEKIKVLLQGATPKVTASLQLEQALYAASQQPVVALPMLDRFILNNPAHPRINEARLAMAFSALQQVPPARSLARALLDSIDADDDLAETVLLAKIQLTSSGDDPAINIEQSRAFLAQFPDSSHIAEVTLTHGTALYQNGDLSDARQTLQMLEKTHPDQAAPALLIAARAAARTGTPQSLTEAIELFDKVIQSKSTLSSFASLEKARSLIDTKSPASLQQAVNELTALLTTLPAESPLNTTTALLLMESLYALGGSDATQYQLGLDLQKKLLENEPLAIDDKHRVSYYRGLTLEQLNLQDQALDVYYQVLESAALQAPASWDYLERCGFNAIALLEKNRRWEPAIALAKKMAAFPSPRAEEAAERAKRLSLEHMILDE